MSARFIPSPASTSEASLDDMSRRQLMLYVSLVIKCDKLVAPGQNWGLKILHRAGCPPQWQNHIINMAKILEEKWQKRKFVEEYEIDRCVAEECTTRSFYSEVNLAMDRVPTPFAGART
ncbi:hypothetical protein FOZ62_003750 [Perkinsus olseni]|uniref:Uncharacterized protein n=1 Tax=Perkinsus olseni TaxID=32597 RepID=A0A7J6TFT5_PEROL|nr:hypothetical protein FOZ62_003750 [Perkinsus olseni]